MLPLLFELAGLATVGYLGLLGSTVGTRTAAVRAVQLFVVFAAAFLFFQPLAGLIDPLIASVGGRDLTSMPWSMFLAFVMLYALLAAVAVIVTPPEWTALPDEPESLPRREKIGGGIMGGTAGILLVGTVLVVLSLLPLPGWLRIRTHSMYYDLGAVCIRAVTPFLGTLAVRGEPIAEKGTPGAQMASEAWADVDGDGNRGDDDLYVDRDGSGSFSEQQYYLDYDNDYQRRVGLLEKYALWCWDDASLSARMTNVGPAAPPSRPDPDEQPAAKAKPAAADDDIPGKKPGKTEAEPATPKTEEEPSDDF